LICASAAPRGSVVHSLEGVTFIKKKNFKYKTIETSTYEIVLLYKNLVRVSNVDKIFKKKTIVMSSLKNLARKTAVVRGGRTNSSPLSTPFCSLLPLNSIMTASFLVSSSHKFSMVNTVNNQKMICLRKVDLWGRPASKCI